jgi:hypothetical protein
MGSTTTPLENATREILQAKQLYTEQILFALPPPAKVFDKAISLNPNRAQNRQQGIATHRAAVAQMISIEEPAQWLVPSEDSDAWMWDMQTAFNSNLLPELSPYSQRCECVARSTSG